MRARPVRRGSVEVLRLEVISPIQISVALKCFKAVLEWNTRSGAARRSFPAPAAVMECRRAAAPGAVGAPRAPPGPRRAARPRPDAGSRAARHAARALQHY